MAAYCGEPADSLAVALNEVNVTAVKETAQLREEAQAATILTRAQLEQTGVAGIKGISDEVPNFFMPDYGSRITSTIYVRGIGARMDQPSVGLIVDNVAYLNKDAYDFDISDLAAVEMLRGPQSTLYGRNTMAGVINVTTLSPMRYQGWRIMAEGGNGERIKGNVGWYHKFSERTGFSISGGYSHQGGFFRNGYNGEKIDKENNWTLRTKFNWGITPTVYLQNTASAGILRQGGYPYEFRETGRIAYNDTCFYRRFTFADGLTIRHTGERMTLTSVTSVQHIDDNMTLDQDFLPEDFFTLTQKKRETALTEDLVARKRHNGGVYDWLCGLFAFYKHLDMEAPVTFKDVGISRLIEDHRNEANPAYPVRWNERSFPLNSDFRIPTWGVSAYHKSDISLDNWEISAGLRLDYEKSTLHYHSYCSTSYSILQAGDGEPAIIGNIPIDIDDYGNLSTDHINLLPTVSVSYRFESGIGNIYAKWSKGYKSGGFNTQMFSDVLQQRLMRIMGIGAQYNVDDIVSYKPEQSWNYEVGAHLDLLQGRLTADLAAFYIDCRDQQLTMFPDGTTTGRIMTNAGKTRSFGGEATLAANVADGLSLRMSYGYTNARFRKFFNGISDFKGKYLPYAPRNTLFAQGVWVVPTKVSLIGNLTFDISLRGAGKIFWNEENSVSQPFYALLGASVSMGNKDYTLQVWGKNLTDTRYHTFYFLSMGNEFLQRGRGVEWGATLRVNI